MRETNGVHGEDIDAREFAAKLASRDVKIKPRRSARLCVVDAAPVADVTPVSLMTFEGE